MSTKTMFKTAEVSKLTEAEIKALVSYCLSVSSGCPDMTIGDIHEFVLSHGKRPVTIQRTQRVINNMIGEGMAKERPDVSTPGKRLSHRYYGTSATFRLMLAYVRHLPAKLGALADKLLEQTNDALGELNTKVRAANKLNCDGLMGADGFTAQQSEMFEGQ